jgi:hypothetical protein
MKKAKGFPLGLFIGASLLSLFVLVLAYIIYSVYSGYQEYGYQVADLREPQKTQYFFETDIKQIDPFITYQPDSSTMLRGPVISANDPAIGDIQGKVKMVVFSDFACHYCQAVESQAIDAAEVDSEVSFIRKDYPDGGRESESFQAAAAARCAGKQASYWEYHNLLYKYGDYSKNNLIDYARELDLDVGLFQTCLDSPDIIQSIEDNIEEANALGITGVPFLYVNDQEVMGDISDKDMERLINIELKD